MSDRLFVLGVSVISIILVSACESHIQTTSGRAYLEKYNSSPAVTQVGNADNRPWFDEKVRSIAAVEPTLRFPARIGLARIENGDLSPISVPEAEAWMKAAERMGPKFGTFLPVSRLVAEMVGNQYNKTVPWAVRRGHQLGALHRVIEKIRLGAARQHLDAVLVYEVYGKSEQEGNLIGALNFTIIGAFMLPGESIRAKGFASALLVDVRNGYPYGTARKVVNFEDITPSAGSSDVREVAHQLTMVRAAVALVPEVEKMMTKLRASLVKLDAANATASATPKSVPAAKVSAPTSP